ncbi:hypothetical protein ABW21_db0200434 [Orbilia brochopaga]|nr:hypothetical protein ABW21_db0200434 [Drechslerella brochopaga]
MSSFVDRCYQLIDTNEHGSANMVTHAKTPSRISIYRYLKPHDPYIHEHVPRSKEIERKRNTHYGLYAGGASSRSPTLVIPCAGCLTAPAAAALLLLASLFPPSTFNTNSVKFTGCGGSCGGTTCIRTTAGAGLGVLVDCLFGFPPLLLLSLCLF